MALAFLRSIILWALNNIIKALKATYTVEDTSMAIPRKLPNFPQKIIETDFQWAKIRPDDDNLHSGENDNYWL